MSQREKDQLVHLGKEGPRNVTTTNFSGAYSLSEEEQYFNINEFKDKLQINILKNEEYLLITEIKNIDVSIANALRRIMLSEVPTIAIETVKIYQNTGIIADEILCHRLGLIPFQFDANLIDFREKEEELNENNCFCFKLHVKLKKTSSNQNSIPVFSKDLVWVPLNDHQKEKFKNNHPKVVDENILITKLGVNQEIELVCYLEKGIGKVHAKWSPVSTAVYKMYPVFTFDYQENFNETEKEDLVKLCPKDVFDIDKSTNRLIAKNPLQCSSCRACIEKYPKKISFDKVKNHFVFTIESTGCFSSAEIFKRAIHVLKNKALNIKSKVKIQMTS